MAWELGDVSGASLRVAVGRGRGKPRLSSPSPHRNPERCASARTALLREVLPVRPDLLARAEAGPSSGARLLEPAPRTGPGRVERLSRGGEAGALDRRGGSAYTTTLTCPSSTFTR